jgi:glutamine amidotransferase
VSRARLSRPRRPRRPPPHRRPPDRAAVVLWPSRSIIKQSYDARERLSDASLPSHLGYGNLNGDGFGIGWYSGAPAARADPTPCTFTSVTPAWNNDNLNRCARAGGPAINKSPPRRAWPAHLPHTAPRADPLSAHAPPRRLATKLESGLVFAHVRAAYPGMPVSDQNCHPFSFGNYLFMHNGVVAGFLDVRRRLLAELSDAAYDAVGSFHSDSAVAFGVFLHHLPSLTERQPPEALLRALQAAIATISRVQAEAGVTETSLLNFVVSDGETLVATRYVSHETEAAASLYYAEASAYGRAAATGPAPAAGAAAAAVRSAGAAGAVGARGAAVTGEGDYELAYAGLGTRVCLIASEPVTGRGSDWAAVPRNTALVVCREKGGLLAVLQAPLVAAGEHPRAAEVYRCLEAVAAAAGSDAAALAPAGSAAPLRARRAGGGRAPSDPPGTPRAESAAGSLVRVASAASLGEAAGGAACACHPGGDAHWLTGHRGPVMALAAHGGLLFSGATDAAVKVWCLREGKFLHTLVGHRDPIRALAVAPRGAPGSGGPLLVSAGAKALRLWAGACEAGGAGWRCVGVLPAADGRGSLKAIALDVGLGLVYVGGQDCQVRAYSLAGADAGAADAPELEARHGAAPPAAEPVAATDPAAAHCAAVTCLAAAGALVASGGGDSTVRVWRAGSLEHVATLRGHRGAVLALHAAPGVLLSGGRDCVVRVWDADSLVCRRALSGHTDSVLALASLPAAAARGAGGADFDVAGAGPAAGACAPPEAAEPSSPTAVPEAPLLFASASADGTLRLWSARTLECLQVLHTRGAGAPRLAFDPPEPALALALTAGHVAAGVANGNVLLHGAEEAVAAARARAEGAAAPAAPPGKRRRRGAATGAATGAAAADSDAEGPNGALVAAGAAPPRLELELERALRRFIRIRSVSADPALAEDCFRGAKFLARILESLGAEVKLARPVEGKNPVVLARLGTDPAKKTVTMYGHYDVQVRPV